MIKYQKGISQNYIVQYNINYGILREKKVVSSTKKGKLNVSAEKNLAFDRTSNKP